MTAKCTRSYALKVQAKLIIIIYYRYDMDPEPARSKSQIQPVN